MATFSVEIPDDLLDTTYTAVCAEGGYTPDSGLTPAEFTRNDVLSYLKGKVVRYHVSQAAAEAQLVMDAAVSEAREEIETALAAIV